MRMTNARLAAALLSATALGAAAVQIAANVAAEDAIARFVAAHPYLHVGSVAANPFAARLVIHDVVAEIDGRRLSIGVLRLPVARASGFALVGPAQASPFEDQPAEPAPQAAPAAPGAAEKALTGKALGDTPPTTAPTVIVGADGAASADNVVFQDGTTTFRIKRIDFTGTTSSSADIAALLDPKAVEPWEARLHRLNAVAIVAPEVVADDATPGSERHATFAQVSLSGVSAGKATAGGIGAIDFAIKDGDDAVNGRVGAVKAVGLDLAQLAHVVDTVRPDDMEALKPLYDSLSVTGVTVHGDKNNLALEIASFDETAVKARALKTDALRHAKTEKRSDAERAALTDDLTHSFEIGGMEVKGLSTRSADKDGAVSAFTIGRLALQNFGAGKIGGISLVDLRLDAPQAKIVIATGDIGPFPLPAPKGSLPSTSAMMPTLAKADFGGIDCDIAPSDKGNATPSTPVRFTVKHTGFVSDGAPGELPRSARLAVENLAFDLPPATGGATGALAAMGYKHLDLTTSIATAYDSNTQDLAVRNLTVNGVDMGTLGLGLRLANVTKGIISPNQEVAKASALAILVKGLTLDVSNGGLADRALAWKAKQDGLTPNQERAFLVNLFAEKLPASMNGSANVKIVGTALAKFVTQPKTLHIDIQSKDGLGAASMGLLSDPALLIDSLDVKASADE